jgi:hypothetical protein
MRVLIDVDIGVGSKIFRDFASDTNRATIHHEVADLDVAMAFAKWMIVALALSLVMVCVCAEDKKQDVRILVIGDDVGALLCARVTFSTTPNV